MAPSPAVFVSALAALVTGALAVVAARRRGRSGAPTFAVLMVGAAVWAVAYAVALLPLDPGTRRPLEVPAEVGRALIAPAWLTPPYSRTERHPSRDGWL